MSTSTDSDKKYEYLTTDPIKVPGQKYALVSFVSPQGNQKADKLAMKIRGCFSELEEAKAHAQRLQKLDGAFDVYVVEMYNWVPIPPNPEDVQSQEYQEEWLNTFIKGHHEQQELAKQHFEERKGDMMNNIQTENEQIRKNNEQNADSSTTTLEQDDPWVINKQNKTD